MLLIFHFCSSGLEMCPVSCAFPNCHWLQLTLFKSQTIATVAYTYIWLYHCCHVWWSACHISCWSNQVEACSHQGEERETKADVCLEVPASISILTLVAPYFHCWWAISLRGGEVIRCTHQCNLPQHRRATRRIFALSLEGNPSTPLIFWRWKLDQTDQHTKR